MGKVTYWLESVIFEIDLQDWINKKLKDIS